MQSTESSTQQLIGAILPRLEEYYVAPRQASTLDLVIRDSQAPRWRFKMGPTIEMIALHECVTSPPPDSTLSLSSAILLEILRDPTGFDPRNARSLALGGILIEGANRPAAYWLQLLKRPSPGQRASFARARAGAPAFLVEVPYVIAPEKSARELRELIVNALEHCTPLHLRNILEWPEVHWTLDDWCEQEGTKLLPLQSVSGGYLSVAEFVGALTRKLAVGDTDTVSSYTAGCLLPPEWEARFRLPRLPADAFSPGQLWFGRQCTHSPVTPLHCDLDHSFLAQVLGCKRVRLFSPALEQELYAFDTFNSFRPCRVDVGTPDLNRHPRFANARGVDMVLAPGDLLIIPTGWFHAVWALDHVLSISRILGDNKLMRLREHR